MLNIPQNSNYSTDSKIGQNGNSVASRIFEILDSRKEFQNKPEFIINGLNIERVELLEILV
jgi:hypothetical protein